MVHGALAIPGRTDSDEVVVTPRGDRRRAISTTWPSVTGTPSSRARPARRPGPTAGAPEPVAIDQDGAGKVLLVELDRAAGRATVTVDGADRRAGPGSSSSTSTRPTVAGQPALVDRDRREGRSRTWSSTSGSPASGRTSWTSTSTRSRTRSKGSFLQVRVRDASMPGADRGRDARRPTPSPAPSSGTSRAGSPSSRRPAPTRSPRRPSCATCSASVGCCWPATR